MAGLRSNIMVDEEGLSPTFFHFYRACVHPSIHTALHPQQLVFLQTINVNFKGRIFIEMRKSMFVEAAHDDANIIITVKVKQVEEVFNPAKRMNRNTNPI